MNRIIITVAGPVGCGKTAVVEEVAVALKAIGVPVEFEDPAMIHSERNMTDPADMLNMYLEAGTTVLLREEWTPRAVRRDSEVPHG